MKREKVEKLIEDAKLNERERTALREAVAVLYFADNSDYEGGLWQVVNALAPDLGKQLADEGDMPSVVYKVLNGEEDAPDEDDDDDEDDD
jgi:hypothetical protein